jgi:D-alanyl-lipoteichoic acid acyltransferase DltB (MBOAT superfamily)
MLFNSYVFILFFLPVTLVGYFGLHKIGLHTLAKIELILMSFWFYGYFNPSYLWIMCSSICVNFVFSKLLQLNWNLRSRFVVHFRKLLLKIGILFNLSLIFYFKYFDFFLENINQAFAADFPLQNIVLPLGISFFTFQQVSYVIDSYKMETKEYNFVDYALFVTFFPQLVAGPIVLHDEILPQFENPKNYRVRYNNMARGLYVFAAGLVKKVILADTLGKAVTWGYGSVETLTAADAILVMLSYTFQIYFDFSGYCDMATGIASMFNIHLPMNFNSPYKALSVVDFWDRWHMTLTRFLRTYIYFPLGGSRKGTFRTYLNIILVFLVSGLWHGANWTFILWGFMHGVANALTRAVKKPWKHLPVVIQWLFTFVFVNITWVFFRADTIAQAQEFLGKIFQPGNMQGVTPDLLSQYSLKEFSYIMNKIPYLQNLTVQKNAIVTFLFLFGSLLLCLCFRNNQEKEFRPTAVNALVTVFFLLWGIMSLSGISVFLYFNF